MKDWNKEFAFYAIALYRVGNYTDAALVGAIMFEKAIYALLEKKGISKQSIKDQSRLEKKGDLQLAIELIYQNNLQLGHNDLDEIRRNVRNKIIHEIDINEIDRKKIKPMILFIWKTFDRIAFNQYIGCIDKIDFLTADYAVVGMRELLNENLQDELAEGCSFNGFKLEDFQELYKLREKIFSLGSRIKNEILKVHFKNELYIDVISKVDTTSAYVWMSMNLYNEERVRIDSASASILATPLDLRIYFDIGGGGYQVRQDYYKFLKSDYFLNFKDNIDKDDLKDIELFDNNWYCFIVDKVKLRELNKGDIIKKAEKAEKKLEAYDKNSKITWNRALVGYIIKRGEISFEEIQSKLEIIIKLYYCFEKYRQVQLKRKKFSFKYNIQNLCHKKIKREPIPMDKNFSTKTNKRKK